MSLYTPSGRGGERIDIKKGLFNDDELTLDLHKNHYVDHHHY